MNEFLTILFYKVLADVVIFTAKKLYEFFNKKNK